MLSFTWILEVLRLQCTYQMKISVTVSYMIKVKMWRHTRHRKHEGDTAFNLQIVLQVGYIFVQHG